MEKFNRNYELLVQKGISNSPLVLAGAAFDQNSYVQVKRPLTIEFTVERKNYAYINSSTFRIYNLSQTTRSILRQDQIAYQLYRKVIFNAGYAKNIPTLFSGTLQQGWSVREGDDFVTTLLCTMGGFSSVNGTANLVFKAGTEYKTIIEALIKSLGNFGIARGAVGSYPGVLPKANSYTGNIIENLLVLTGGGFFIDNGKAYALRDNEGFEGGLPTITSATGLIGTPLRETQFIHLDLILEPRAQVGQLVRLDSSTGDSTNGVWKIVAIKHRGTISEAVCKDAVTSLTLCAPTADIVRVSQ